MSPCEGKILNLRDIEQGRERLNHLSTRQLTIDSLPGSREGYSRIKRGPASQHFPIRLNISLDNSGQKGTGTGKVNGQLIVDNPLSLAEQWTLVARRDSEFHRDRRSLTTTAGARVKAERDIRLATTALENRGTTTAQGDMHIFVDAVTATLVPLGR